MLENPVKGLLRLPVFSCHQMIDLQGEIYLRAEAISPRLSDDRRSACDGEPLTCVAMWL